LSLEVEILQRLVRIGFNKEKERNGKIKTSWAYKE